MRGKRSLPHHDFRPPIGYEWTSSLSAGRVPSAISKPPRVRSIQTAACVFALNLIVRQPAGRKKLSNRFVRRSLSACSTGSLEASLANAQRLSG